MAGAGPHILTFYVVRLAKPGLDLDPPLRLDLGRDFRPDGGRDGRGGASTTSSSSADTTAPPPASSTGPGRFASRVDLADPVAALGLRGPLALPPSFGPVYLGEQFACLVSLACAPGPAGADAAAVAVRAELQTDGGRVPLYDTGESPLAILHPGARHDFILRHDVRCLGPHTLVCTAAYTSAVSGERKHLPAYFKFTAAPPLAVRTKVRHLPPTAGGGECGGGGGGGGSGGGLSGGPSALVEATVDNLKAGPLALDPPRFDAAAGLVATAVAAGGDSHPPPPIPPSGAASFVFSIRAADPAKSPLPPPGAPLGRLDLRWTGPLGAPGRLQTQEVAAAPAAARAVALSASALPATAPLATPFPVTLRVTSALDVGVGPLRLEPPGAAAAFFEGEDDEEGGGGGGGGSAAAEAPRPPGSTTPPPAPPTPSPPASVFLHGDARPAVPGGDLPPRGSVELAVSLVALAPGVHRLPALRLVHAGDGRVFDVLSGWVRVGDGGGGCGDGVAVPAA
jgi:trafficking protein particle complex subunit 13